MSAYRWCAVRQRPELAGSTYASDSRVITSRNSRRILKIFMAGRDWTTAWARCTRKITNINASKTLATRSPFRSSTFSTWQKPQRADLLMLRRIQTR